MTWNTERDKILTDMWAKGCAMSEIGEKIGVSRNAVAGRIHRLRITKNKDTPSRVRKSRKFKQEMPIGAEPGSSKRFAALKPNECRYEKSGAKKSLDRYCGKKCASGSPYCQRHHDMCYTYKPGKFYVPPERESRKIEFLKAWME